LFDGYEYGAPATIHLHVPNHAPVLREHVQDLAFTRAQLGQPVSIGNLRDYATDPDGDPLRLGVASLSAGGSLTSDDQGNLTFTPSPGMMHYTQAAPSEIDVRVVAWGDGSNVPTSGASLAILGVDNQDLLHIRTFDASGTRILHIDETQIAPGELRTELKHRVLDLVPPHVLTSSEKTELITMLLSLVGQPVPTPAGTMQLTFSLAVSDGYVSSLSDAVTVNLGYPNTPPVAHDLRLIIPVDRGITQHFTLQSLNGYLGDPQFHDGDGDVLHAAVLTVSTIGTMNEQDGEINYRVLPPGIDTTLNTPLYSGSFTYKLTDGYVDSNVATVTVVPERGEPTLFPDAFVVSTSDPGAVFTRDILRNDVFPDGTSLAGRATPILFSSDVAIKDSTGRLIEPGEELDFRNAGITFPEIQYFQSARLDYFIDYRVRYQLNDDPHPPTRTTDGPAFLRGLSFVLIRLVDHPTADDDGVPDDVEAQSPHSGDGNGDGIPDAQQVNVASLPNAHDGGYVTLAAPAGSQLFGVEALDHATPSSDSQPPPAPPPPGVAFPLGFIQFELLVPPVPASPNGDGNLARSITVDVISASDLPPDFVYYKYGPTPDNQTDHWYEFTYAGPTATDQTGAERINARVVRLHFIDGQRGDDDLTRDGVIHDVGGPAVSGADLALSQTATPAAPLVGAELTFTLTVSNQGAIAAPGVAVTDSLPAGVTFVSAVSSVGSCVFNAGTVRCSIGTLGPGASATIRVIVRPTAPGPFTNRARASGALPDPVANNDEATAAVTAVAPSPFARFVLTLYVEILDRVPDPRTLDLWVGRLEKRTPPQRVARAIYSSREHHMLLRRHLAPHITFQRSLRDALRAERSAAALPVLPAE
jgi:uncharacterized repeat protein (TIGR01451 family)